MRLKIFWYLHQVRAFFIPCLLERLMIMYSIRDIGIMDNCVSSTLIQFSIWLLLLYCPMFHVPVLKSAARFSLASGCRQLLLVSLFLCPLCLCTHCSIAAPLNCVLTTSAPRIWVSELALNQFLHATSNWYIGQAGQTAWWVVGWLCIVRWHLK